MKKLISCTFFILIGCLFAGGLVGQTQVQLLDLTIMPDLDQSGVSTDSIELDVAFKISNANQAVKTHFWLGTAKDSSNVLIVEAVFNTIGTITYLEYSGISNEVKNYAAGFQIKISKAAYASFSASTLFVETSNGQMTSRLYYTK